MHQYYKDNKGIDQCCSRGREESIPKKLAKQTKQKTRAKYWEDLELEYLSLSQIPTVVQHGGSDWQKSYKRTIAFSLA